MQQLWLLDRAEGNESKNWRMFEKVQIDCRISSIQSHTFAPKSGERVCVCLFLVFLCNRIFSYFFFLEISMWFYRREAKHIHKLELSTEGA